MSLYPTWLYKKRFAIDNRGNPASMAGCQVRLTLDSAFPYNLCKTGGADLRVTASDQTTLLAYWIESWNLGGTSYVWVKLSADVAAASQGVAWLWFGNAAATAATSEAATVEPLPVTGALYTNTAASTVPVVATGILDTYPAVCSIVFTWVPASTIGPGTGGGLRLLTKFNSTAPSYNFLDLYADNSAGGLVLRVYRANAQLATTQPLATQTKTFVAGQRYTIVLMLNGNQVILYINGKRELWLRSQMPLAGGLQGLTFGGYNETGTPSNIMPGTYSDMAVYPRQVRQAEAYALSERRKNYAKDQISKWAKNRYPLVSQVATDHDLQEPSLLNIGGVWHLYATTGMGDAPTQLFISLRTSTDLINWTYVGAVVGQGLGGEAGPAFRSFARVFGAQVYLYYQTAINAFGGPIRLVKSVTGTSFASPVTVLSPAGVAGQWNYGHHSVAVYKDGAVWRMLVDGDDGDNNHARYELGYLESSTGEAFTLSGTNPRRGMQFGTVSGVSGGMYGGPYMDKVDGLFHTWYQTTFAANNQPSLGLTQRILPTEIRHSHTPDFAVFTKPTDDPIVPIDQPYEVDQTADPAISEIAGKTVMVYSCVKNAYFVEEPGFSSRLGIMEFDGTLSQLTTDLAITSEPHTAGNAIGGPMKLLFNNGRPIFRNGKLVTL